MQVRKDVRFRAWLSKTGRLMKASACRFYLDLVLGAKQGQQQIDTIANVKEQGSI